MAQFNFDATSYTPAAAGASATRAPLPKGDYPAIIIESEIKTTKAGDGQYIELAMQVIDGEYSGRRIWDRLNVSNPNKQAEEIAKAALQSLCVALSIKVLNDTSELHDKPFLLALDIDRKDPTRNRVMAYLPPLTAGAAAMAASRSSAAPAPAKKPWEK